MVLLMTLGALVVWEAVKWGAMMVFQEWTPGASARKLKRLRKLRDATALAIEKEMNRLRDENASSPSRALQEDAEPRTPPVTTRAPTASPTTTASQPQGPSSSQQEFHYTQNLGSEWTISSTPTPTTEELERVCVDTIMLMRCEEIRPALRASSLPTSGLKEDLAHRLGQVLASRVRSGGPTVRQLKYLLFLWRSRDLAGKILLNWDQLQDRVRTSQTIHRWKTI